VTRTLPLEIYLQREADPDAAVALSMLLIGVAAVIVVAVGSRRFSGWGAPDSHG
jgi:molybdate transport system permease protein